MCREGQQAETVPNTIAPFARGGKGSLARDVVGSRATKTRVSKSSLQLSQHQLFTGLPLRTHRGSGNGAPCVLHDGSVPKDRAIVAASVWLVKSHHACMFRCILQAGRHFEPGPWRPSNRAAVTGRVLRARPARAWRAPG